MTGHQIKKPAIFISHASSDGEFANAIKQEIEKVFADGVNVFCTSSPGAISVGSDWLETIEGKLGTAQAIIVIVTPVSIEKPWLWFELGATWLKGRTGNCLIYPLCAPEINLSVLPSPLDRLQALSMGKAPDLTILFEALIKQFGFGKITTFKASNIIKRIPKYKNIKVEEIDLNEKVFYSGKYTGYTDDELMEVIDTELFHPDCAKYEDWHEREEQIGKGKLLHFRQIDKNIDLPPGTAKRLMNKVAERYSMTPVYEDINVIRYKYDDDREDDDRIVGNESYNKSCGDERVPQVTFSDEQSFEIFKSSSCSLTFTSGSRHSIHRWTISMMDKFGS